MKEMPKLTKASEQLLSNALGDVAELTNTGVSPDDAIVKVASAEKIPAGQVRLMVRAFNNGRSVGHLRIHDSLEEKAASFDIANASNILERMFPSEHTTASQEKQAAVVSSDYSISPAGWVERKKQAEKRAGMTKTASVAAESPYPDNPLRMGKQAISSLRTMRRDLEEAKQSIVGAAYTALGSIEKLASYFREPTAIPFESVRANAEVYYGERANKLMEKVSEHKIPLRRKGDTQLRVDWDAEPYTLVKAALDAASNFITLRKQYDELEGAHIEKRSETLRPFSVAQEPAVTTGSVWDNPSQTEKQAIGLFGLGVAGMAGGTAKGMAEHFSPKSREDLVQDRLNRLAESPHEDKLREISGRTMMHDLVTTDPVLTNFDYEDVLEAYNHLAAVAPRAMQQRITAKALLRKYMEQAESVDLFDVDQLLGVESRIAERDSPKSFAGTHSMGVARELGPPASSSPSAPQSAFSDVGDRVSGTGEGIAGAGKGLVEGIVRAGGGAEDMFKSPQKEKPQQTA